MPGIETVQFQTVHQPGGALNDMVVGLATDDQELTSRLRAGSAGIETMPPITMDLPEDFASRLLNFFDRYLHHSAGMDAYNCHRFALAMIDSPQKDDGGFLVEATDIQRIVANGSPVETLAFGQHGVITAYTNQRRKPLHSIIGLEASAGTVPECIEVSCIDGPMRIGSYAGSSVIQRAGYSSAELYALPQIAS
jgi:hypothetical protein